MLQVKSWFINKNFSDREAYALSDANYTILKETEKAYFLDGNTDYGHIKFWCPKSCTFEEEYDEDYELEMAKKGDELYEKLEKGLAYNSLLKQICIDNHIKGVSMKRRLRNETLINLLTAQGIEVPAKA